MNQDLRNKIFFIIRSVITEGFTFPNDISLSSEDCETILLFSQRQSIFPLIYQGIKSINCHDYDTVLKKWETVFLKYKYNFVQKDNSLSVISNTFEKNRISYILLKGAVVRSLYPQKWMRTSSDIDVLVHESDLERAINVLEHNTDFKSIGNRSYHDVSLINRRIHLELHFSIKENISNIDQILEKTWEYAIQSVPGYRYDLTPEFQIFYTLAHINHHITNSGIGIRPFIDLWLLVNKTSFDHTILQRILSQTSLQVFFDQSMLLANSWMTNAEQSETTKMFESYCLKGGALGNREDSLLSRQRNHRKYNYIFHRVFATRELLQEEYPELRTKPNRLFYYQIKRWKRLSKKQKRINALNEVSNVRKTKKESIEAYNDFLNRIGL